MSQPDERPLPCGRGRVLMLGTVVLATAAAAVLAMGAQDARLLRLGLVAALWAALLGAFAAARMRREISSAALRADELRTVYQLELEREVAARREHTLTVERELRERADQAERSEIAVLRTELAAMRMSLEKLVSGQSLVERVTSHAESVRLLPVATYPHKLVDSAPTSRDDTELRFGPGPGCQLEPNTHARPLAEPAISGYRQWNPAVLSAPAWEPEPARNGKHGTSSQESPGSSNNGSHNNGHHNNGSHNNGHHNNGGGAQRVVQDESVVGPQRSVNDLLAAHGGGSAPRRRRSREGDPLA